jgi:hypothetical protein
MRIKLALLVFFVALLSQVAMAQSAGTFTITQSVIATGGEQNTAGGNFSLNGTIGQSAAGVQAASGSFVQVSGFWTPDQITPTADLAIVGGRVTNASGQGIRKARVMMIRANGEAWTALTDSSGHFRFTNVMVGETYIFTVSAKRYGFSQNTQVRTILGDTDDINFVADN